MTGPPRTAYSSPTTPATRLLVHADDLSGAAEAAALLRTASPAGATLRLRPGPPADGLTVVDLDTRQLTEQAAEARARDAVEGSEGLLLTKIDSLLRGNLAAHLHVLDPAHHPVVLAPALPSAGRTVVDGVPLVHGKPLRATEAWMQEQTPAPATLLAATGGAELIDLATVRRSAADLRQKVATVTAAGRVAACDAMTDDDLDRLVDATWDLPGIRYVGAGGLAAALGRHLSRHTVAPAARRPRATSTTTASNCGSADAPTSKSPTDSPLPPGAPRRHPAAPADPQQHPAAAADPQRPAALGDPQRTVGTADPRRRRAGTGGPRRCAAGPLFVVGTAEGSAIDQLTALAEATTVVPVTLTAADLRAGRELSYVDTAADALQAGNCVVLRADPVSAAPGLSPSLVATALASVAARLVAGSNDLVDLVLTGGHTARTVLDALGIDQLTVVGDVHHGAVLLQAPDGRRIVTRPGSFGDRLSFADIHTALRFPSSPEGHHIVTSSPSTSTPELPRIAVTMGDGAGVGPEVCVGALLAGTVTTSCRPVVIGDANRLRQAANILGLGAEVVAVDQVEDAVFTPGRINVVDLGLLPDDLPWGEVSAVAGDAAYQYVKVAADLALQGRVSAICTAPLNKAALQAGGHLFPGHTEMLAELTGTEEVSMMLSTPKVKVVHVTTHIGLIDAVARIEPGLVERTIRRGHAAMLSAGVPEPRIGVCAINPHAGENGLFGYGEEAEKIEPGIAAARADGIDARGPLPADTAFFLAGRGDYDLIVAMYHDQGHGPVKVLGIDTGVNITVGLPVIRTSVDHGTAFDIAGTGTVTIDSMIEALRQAAEMSRAATTA